MLRIKVLAGVVGVLMLVAGIVATPASAVPQNGHYYYLINKHSGKCANVQAAARSNGAHLIQWDCYAPQQNDYWGVFYVNDIMFRLQNLNSGKCANVQGASPYNSAYVIQYDCGTPASNDVWYLRDTGVSGYAYIVNFNSQKCLNVQGSSLNNGAYLIQYDCGAPGQNDMWHFG